MGTEHSISSPSEIELIDDRILVRSVRPEEITEFGVYVPEPTVKAQAERVQAGEVMVVGPGRFTSDGRREAMMDIEAGDIVFYPQYLGYLLIIPDPETKEDVEYRVFGQHDLFGVKKVAPRGPKALRESTELQHAEKV